MIDIIMWWLVILIFFLGVEVFTLGFASINFAVGALAATIAAACQLSVTMQVALFLVVSLPLLCFVRPRARKYFNQSL